MKTCQSCGCAPCSCASASILNQPQIIQPTVSGGTFTNPNIVNPAITDGTISGTALTGVTIDGTSLGTQAPDGDCSNALATTGFVCTAISQAVSSTNPDFCAEVQTCVAGAPTLCADIISCINTTPGSISNVLAFDPLVFSTQLQVGVVRLATQSEVDGVSCGVAMEPCTLQAMFDSGGPSAMWTSFSNAVIAILGGPDLCTAVAACGFAPLASPVFTGDPQAPTPAPGDSDTSIATTAFVQAAVAAIVGSQMVIETFTTPGAHLVVVPAGQTTVWITASSGGGGGGTVVTPPGTGVGGGGGSGSAVSDMALTVVPGETLTINIGAGGAGAPAALGPIGSNGASTTVTGSVSGLLLTLNGGFAGTQNAGGSVPVQGGGQPGAFAIAGPPDIRGNGGSNIAGGVGGVVSSAAAIGSPGIRGGGGAGGTGAIAGTAGGDGFAVVRYTN